MNSTSDTRDDVLRPDVFTYTRPVVDPRDAIAREKALGRLLDYLRRREYVAVLAPRQSGKTTFLYQVKASLRHSVYIDLESAAFGTLNELLGPFLLKLAVTDDEKRSLAGIRTFDELLRSPFVRGRIFLIDEIGASRSIAAEFLRSIRARYNESAPPAVRNSPTVTHDEERPPLFVIAGSTDLAELTLEANPAISPYNIAQTLWLDDFTYEELRPFIKRVSSKFTDDAIHLIADQTNGHPFLVQFLCDWLNQFSAEMLTAKLSNLEDSVYDSGIEDSVNIHSMIWHLWHGSPPADDALVMVAAILRGERIPFMRGNTLIRGLFLRHGCLRNHDGSCAIRNKIYDFVLRRNFDISRITQSEAAFPASTFPSVDQREEDKRAILALLAAEGRMSLSSLSVRTHIPPQRLDVALRQLDTRVEVIEGRQGGTLEKFLTADKRGTENV